MLLLLLLLVILLFGLGTAVKLTFLWVLALLVLLLVGGLFLNGRRQ